MRLLKPSISFPPAPIGGYLLVGLSTDLSPRFCERLRAWGANVTHHWPYLADSGKIPKMVVGVLIVTDACAHSLSDRAKHAARKSGVPIFYISRQWSRTKTRLPGLGFVLGPPPKTVETTEAVPIETTKEEAVPIETTKEEAVPIEKRKREPTTIHAAKAKVSLRAAKAKALERKVLDWWVDQCPHGLCYTNNLRKIIPGCPVGRSKMEAVFTAERLTGLGLRRYRCKVTHSKPGKLKTTGTTLIAWAESQSVLTANWLTWAPPHMEITEMVHEPPKGGCPGGGPAVFPEPKVVKAPAPPPRKAAPAAKPRLKKPPAATPKHTALSLSRLLLAALRAEGLHGIKITVANGEIVVLRPTVVVTEEKWG